MALMTRSTKYANVELNHVSARRTGATFAQTPCNVTDFGTTPPENGMLLVLDRQAGEVKKPASADVKVLLHNSEVKIYDNINRVGYGSYAPGEVDQLLPRLYELQVGDLFTTNAIELAGNAEDATLEGKYGVPHTSGNIAISAAAPAATVKVALQVVKFTTLPNGDKACQFEVVRVGGKA